MKSSSLNPPCGSSSQYLILDKTQAINSDKLFGLGNEVCIRHQGEDYRLRRTRNGKLILTK